MKPWKAEWHNWYLDCIVVMSFGSAGLHVLILLTVIVIIVTKAVYSIRLNYKFLLDFRSTCIELR